MSSKLKRLDCKWIKISFIHTQYSSLSFAEMEHTHKKDVGLRILKTTAVVQTGSEITEKKKDRKLNKDATQMASFQ